MFYIFNWILCILKLFKHHFHLLFHLVRLLNYQIFDLLSILNSCVTDCINLYCSLSWHSRIKISIVQNQSFLHWILLRQIFVMNKWCMFQLYVVYLNIVISFDTRILCIFFFYDTKMLVLREILLVIQCYVLLNIHFYYEKI